MKKKKYKISFDQEEAINNALGEVGRAVNGDAYKADIAYFFEHKARFKRTLCRIMELCPNGGRIFDIGSHYLHLSTALHLLGYDVVAMDVASFSDQPVLKARASKYKIDYNVVDHIERGEFLDGRQEFFDLVLFTEIMEHITFNPIHFWRRVYDLMKVGSLIYITTPNSLTPWKILHVLKNIVTLRGCGLSVSEIFYTVTYGHHWKEYSGRELCDYFMLLSPDFSVELKNFNCPAPDGSQPFSIKGSVRRLVHWLSHFVPVFRDQLEVVVRLRSRSRWMIDPPKFI